MTHAAITAVNSATAPAGHIPSGIVAGSNTIDGVTFNNPGAALAPSTIVPGNATTTFNFLDVPAGSPAPGVGGFTLQFNDLHDGPGTSSLTINATTLSGQTVSLVNLEGAGGGNPSIGGGATGNFQWATSTNGGPLVNSGVFVPLGQATSSFFTLTANSGSDPIVSANFTWASPGGNDGAIFEGVSIIPVPEPSTSLLASLALLGGALRRKR